MGMVSFGEQTVPSGITALLIAMMPVWVAILGRDLPRRAAAAAGGRRDRRRVRRRRDPDRTVGVRRIRGARRARAGGDHRLADLVGERLAVRVPSRAPAQAAAARHRHPDALRRPRPRGDERRRAASCRGSGSTPISPASLGALAYLTSSAASSRSPPTAGCCAWRRSR